MKYSKQLSIGFRKKCFSTFMRIPFKDRQIVFNNNFEKYCKIFISTELYQTSLEVARQRPILK